MLANQTKETFAKVLLAAKEALVATKELLAAPNKVLLAIKEYLLINKKPFLMTKEYFFATKEGFKSPPDSQNLPGECRFRRQKLPVALQTALPRMEKVVSTTDGHRCLQICAGNPSAVGVASL